MFGRFDAALLNAIRMLNKANTCLKNIISTTLSDTCPRDASTFDDSHLTLQIKCLDEYRLRYRRQS